MKEKLFNFITELIKLVIVIYALLAVFLTVVFIGLLPIATIYGTYYMLTLM